MDIQDQEGIIGSGGISHFLSISLSSPKDGSGKADEDRIIPSIGIGFGVLPECPRKSNHLGFGTCCSDRIDRCLGGGRPLYQLRSLGSQAASSLPLCSIEIMGLIHDTYSSAICSYRVVQLTKDDLVFIGVFLSEQGPNTSKLSSATLLIPKVEARSHSHY
jgi:hypothetical protein